MNIEESKINLKNLIYQYKRTIQLYGDFFIGLQEIQAIETLLTAYEKEKEKNKEAIDYIYDLLNELDVPNVGTDDIKNLLRILEE